MWVQDMGLGVKDKSSKRMKMVMEMVGIVLYL